MQCLNQILVSVPLFLSRFCLRLPRSWRSVGSRVRQLDSLPCVYVKPCPSLTRTKITSQSNSNWTSKYWATLLYGQSDIPPISGFLLFLFCSLLLLAGFSMTHLTSLTLTLKGAALLGFPCDTRATESLPQPGQSYGVKAIWSLICSDGSTVHCRAVCVTPYITQSLSFSLAVLYNCPVGLPHTSPQSQAQEKVFAALLIGIVNTSIVWHAGMCESSDVQGCVSVKVSVGRVSQFHITRRVTSISSA